MNAGRVGRILIELATLIAGSTEPRKEQSISNISKAELAQKSKLSADAAEFIPKSYSVKQATVIISCCTMHANNFSVEILKWFEYFCIPQHQQPSAKGLPKPSVQTRLVAARNMSRQAEMQSSGYNYDTSQNYQDVEQMQQFDNFSQQQQVEQSVGVQDYGSFDGGSGDYKDKHQVHTSINII